MKRRNTQGIKLVEIALFGILILSTACVKELKKNMLNEEPNATPPSSEGNTPSIPELDEFIFKIDRFKKGIVPRKLDAVQVAKYLTDKTDLTLKLISLEQVEKVAVFYHSNEVTAKFKSLLKKQETNSEELRKSIILARIIAKLGNAEDIKFADDYYNYLVSRADTFEDFKDLMFLHENLSRGINSMLINQKVKEKVEVLKAQKDSNSAAKLKYLNFYEKILLALSRAEKVQTDKDKILAIADPKKRIEEEIKVYLSIEYGYLEYMQPWVALRINRETFAPQLAQQNVRADNPALRAEVAKSFRAFLDKLNTFTIETKEEKESAKISLLRGIKFFDGKVSDEEEEFLEVNKSDQSDVLANEGFLLQ